MTTFLLRCTLPALALFQLAMLKAHAAYAPGIVAADARWVVYADFNALRTSTLGKELITAVEKAQTQTTGGTIGLDIPKVLATVGSLTAYGTNLSADPQAVDGALIAQGTADLRKITEGLLLQGTLTHPEVFIEVTDLPFPAYAIVGPKTPDGAKTQVMVAFPPEPLVIVSKSRAQLLKARDVFRGAAPSLAQSKSSTLGRLGPQAEGAYLFAACIVPAEPIFPQNAPQTRFLQLAHSGAIAFGERGPDTFAHAELLASSDQNADKLMKILQGMTSMLSLAETNDKQLAEFMNSTAVSREKETVTLQLAYSSARLVQMAQTLRTQAEVRPTPRQPAITVGTTLAEWGGDNVAPSASTVTEPIWRTIENVRLVNGSLITLGRALNGGQNARFDRIEIVPPEGQGAPLVFRTDFMRNLRGSMWQFPFPGADGVYTLRVAYVGDAEGKTKFAVSVRNPNEPEQRPTPSSGPLIPEPKWKQ